MFTVYKISLPVKRLNQNLSKNKGPATGGSPYLSLGNMSLSSYGHEAKLFGTLYFISDIPHTII